MRVPIVPPTPCTTESFCHVPTALDAVSSAAVITQAREGRTSRPLDFPAGLRPRDAAEAYAVQDAVVRARGPIAGWKVGAAQPLAQAVTLSVNGAVAVQHATWGNPAGDPLRLLVWLANEGARSLGGLRAGHWVKTGSCTGTVLVAPGAEVVADFPGLGQAVLHLR